MPSTSAKIALPLIQSDLVTPPTRAALLARVNRAQSDSQPSFFTPLEFNQLIKICSRLMGDPTSEPENAEAPIQFTAVQMDERLATRKSDGWRYDALPSDGEAYKFGLLVLQQAASERFNLPFAELSDAQIDQLLAGAASGALSTDAADFDISLWFGELLAETVECFYSHPEALREIRYVGFADAPGWDRTGLNELEAREAAPAIERH